MKFKASYETEVYLSQNDYLVIKQLDPLDNNPAIVCLTHDQVKILAKEFAKWAKNGDWWSSVVREDSDPA